MDTRTIEKIEKYLDRELKAEDIRNIEDQMKNDPDFAKEVQLNKELSQAIMEKDVMNLRRSMQSIHEKHNNRRKLAGKVIKLFEEKTYATTSIAAAIVLALVVGALMIFGVQNQPAENLFASYYQPDEAVMIVRSGSNPEDIDLKEALLAYHEKNYDNAIALLDKQNNNILAKYYLGLSYLETDKINNAITTFKAIIDHNNNLFVEQAEWYLALCYVKNDQEAEAKIWFEKIADSESIFKEKARRVMKNM